MELYQYQKDTVKAVLGGAHLVIAECSAGKTVCGLTWAKETGKPKVLVVTTASVRDCASYQREAEAWYPEWYKSLSLSASFSVVSWAGLAKWASAHLSELDDYAVIFDEVASAKGAGKRGRQSLQGKAFLKITARTDCWTGWTATPSECWEDCAAYLIACGKVRNKTDFYNRFVVEVRYPFPKTLGYRNEAELQEIWDSVKHNVDASSVLAELPEEHHKVIHFKAPTGYKQVEKTSCDLDGEFLDNSSKYSHYLRQMCCTPKKLEWVKEFIEHLNNRCVIFYNYRKDGDQLEETLKTVLKGKGRIWRIDGGSHDIPTEETCGAHDVVLAQWQSGAFGLNLQFISHWISITPYYGYNTSIQARKRIKRIGQKNACRYYYLKCDGTIEDDVYKILNTKSDFSKRTWGFEKQQKYGFNWKEDNSDDD